jgi:hypothetical protein
VAGSSTNAALGDVSAGGMGTPELDATHVVLDQPAGSAGGVTPSKNSVRSKIGSHCPSTRSLLPIASAATILVDPIAAAATRNRQNISRSRLSMKHAFWICSHRISDQLDYNNFPGATATKKHLSLTGGVRIKDISPESRVHRSRAASRQTKSTSVCRH